MEMNGASNSSDSSCNSLGDEADYDLEHPAWELERLRSAAAEGRLPSPRALAWAALLGALPAPRDAAPLRAALDASRAQYEELQRRLSRDPRAAAGDDPLSQRHESVWRQHFCDQELRALILQDVTRTFPGDLYFRGPHVQDLMVRVLFLWARSHAALGYRQGMHEVLAPLLFQLFLDRELAPAGASAAVRHALSADHLEHDSYALFACVMTGLERFYTTGDMIAPTAYGRKLSKNPNEVLRYLDRVREDYLLPLDAELAAHLAACRVSMELFGIRWLRLLFGREFPRAALAELWGFLFAAGPALPDLGLLVAALLIANRHRLLEPEPGAVLAALMRPSAAPVPHVLALARHLRSPADHARPPALLREEEAEEEGAEARAAEDGGGEPGAEDADVARELAALAAVRARLPPAAAALAAALPPRALPPPAARALRELLQLAALLQRRADVEPALEAAEAPEPAPRPRPAAPAGPAAPRAREVPLQLFHRVERPPAPAGLPRPDPLRLRRH